MEAARIITNAFIEKLNIKSSETQSSMGRSVDSQITKCNAPSYEEKPLSKTFKAEKVLNVSARYPVFSADGSWLLFQSWAREKESIYAYRTKDSKIFRLSPEGDDTPNERHPAIISFSDKSLTFVFGSGYKQASPELETLMVREWPKMLTRPLVKDASLGGSIPAVQGGKVYFAGYTKDGPLATPNIIVKDIQNDSLKFITRDEHEDWRPAVSPTGDLSFISKRSSKFQLHEVTADGKSRVIVEHDQDIWDPAYSPNGKYLAFAAKTGAHWVIKLLNRISGEIVQVTDGQQDDWDPAFHPSGNVLFFGRSYGREPYIYAACLKGE
jgi:WD40 repeat protein